MTQLKDTSVIGAVQGALLDDPEFLKSLVERVVQRILETEMAEHLGAGSYERTDKRRGYRNGYKPRTLKTRVGTLELLVPQDREGTFRTELFDMYQRNEKALVLSMMEMYVQGVSTRKVRKITEELCGTSFSKSTVSRLAEQLDEELDGWLDRPLEEKYPALLADAQFHKVRDNGRVVSKAVLTIKGIRADGKREILLVTVGRTENEVYWDEAFKALKKRSVSGVELVVSDDHAGLRKAIEKHFPGIAWQRCQHHFRENAKKRVPKSRQSEVYEGLREIFEAKDKEQARALRDEFVERTREELPDLAAFVDEEIEDCFAVFDRPKKQRRRLRTTNSLERYHEEIKRRTHVVRIFPNDRALLRLVGTLAMEFSEEWLCGKMYIRMEEDKKPVAEKKSKNRRAA